MSPSPPLPRLPLPELTRLAKAAMPQRGVQLGEEIERFPSHWQGRGRWGTQHLAEPGPEKTSPPAIACHQHFGFLEFFREHFLSLLTPFPRLFAGPSAWRIYSFILCLASLFSPRSVQHHLTFLYRTGHFHSLCVGEASWTAWLIFLQFLLCLDQSTLGMRKCTVELSFCNS